MPRLSVTRAASALIWECKDQGKTCRETVEILRERLGIPLDHSTVAKHLKKGRPTRQAQAGLEVDASPSVATERNLDEVASLEEQVGRLQQLLAEPLEPRDRAAVNAELRQTFASIRKAKQAARQDEQLQDADAAWVLAKIKRFDSMNKTSEPDVSPELPSTTRAATGG